MHSKMQNDVKRATTITYKPMLDRHGCIAGRLVMQVKQGSTAKAERNSLSTWIYRQQLLKGTAVLDFHKLLTLVCTRLPDWATKIML